MIAYLACFCFVASTSWGALFFVLLADLVDGRWLEALRPRFVTLSRALVALPLLFIPIAARARTLYPWEEVDGALSLAGFDGKSAAALIVLAVLAVVVGGRSAGRPPALRPPAQQRPLRAALGMILLVSLSTLASFDWIMALTPGFHSTIFGLVVLASGAASALGLALLFDRGAAAASLDAATMLFALVMFWGYVSFCQLLIIWLADKPDEARFYVERWRGPWPAVAAFLVVAALAVPLFALLFRALKARPRAVAVAGAFVAITQLVDMVWLVAPAASSSASTRSPDERAALSGSSDDETERR